MCRGLCGTHYMRWRKHGSPHALLPRAGGRKFLATACSIDGCDNRGPYVRSWCRSHYDRWKKYGDPLGVDPRKLPRFCTVEECDRPLFAKGFCNMHYIRAKTHGDPGEAARRSAPPGTGSINSQGYHVTSVPGRHRRSMLTHRLVMEEMIGRELYPFENVHHRNGDRSDNRPENLELWVKTQPCGQRPSDIVHFMVTNYRELIMEELEQTSFVITGGNA